MNRICVFCGSQTGSNPAYERLARDLGLLLVEHNQTLVFGGGSVGLMGVIADAVLEKGGDCIGVIPQKLATKELLHTGVGDMRCVPDMHTRKAQMAHLADAFIALPGGFGTLEELFEVVTWAQLNFHHKPIGLLNAGGYFDHLIQFIDHAIAEKFIHEKYSQLITVSDSPEKLLTEMMSMIRRNEVLDSDSGFNEDLI